MGGLAGRLGPITLAEIKQGWARGQLTATTLFWADSMRQPLPLHAIRQLRWLVAQGSCTLPPCLCVCGNTRRCSSRMDLCFSCRRCSAVWGLSGIQGGWDAWCCSHCMGVFFSCHQCSAGWGLSGILAE